MRKLLTIAAALTAGTLSLNALAEQQQTAAEDGMKVTGTVMEVDQDSNEIKIDDQTFVMPDASGGASMMPQVGAEVTLYYEEQNGEKTITRIGQAQ